MYGKARIENASEHPKPPVGEVLEPRRPSCSVYIPGNSGIDMGTFPRRIVGSVVANMAGRYSMRRFLFHLSMLQ